MVKPHLTLFTSLGAAGAIVAISALVLLFVNNSTVQPASPGTPSVPDSSNGPILPSTDVPSYSNYGGNVPVEWPNMTSPEPTNGSNIVGDGGAVNMVNTNIKQQPQEQNTGNSESSHSGGGVHYTQTYYTSSSSGGGSSAGIGSEKSTGAGSPSAGNSNTGNHLNNQTTGGTTANAAGGNNNGNNTNGASNGQSTGTSSTTTNDIANNPQQPPLPQYTSELVCADAASPNINQTTNIPLNTIVQCHTHNTDPAVNSFHFWIVGPDGVKIADSGLQPYTTNDDIKFAWKANATGQYIANVDYYDKQGHQLHLSCDMFVSFFVLPESAVGTISLMGSSVAALGAFMFWKQKKRRADAAATTTSE